MRIVLLGPPGAGKGSLASLIKKNLSVVHLSTGDMLRDEIQKASPLGLEIKALIAHGSLVSDDIVTQLVKSKVIDNVATAPKSYMLDGYPRTVHQAEDLDVMLTKVGTPLDFVIDMETDFDVILQRLVSRLVCRKCGDIYNLNKKAPKIAGKCDLCSGDLYQRSDDNEETIRTRLEVYVQTTQPIIDYYKKQNKIRILNGNLETVDLFHQFAAMLR